MNIFSLLLAALTLGAPQPAEQIQPQLVRTGELYSFRYVEEADIIVSEIHTDDGNTWTVEDFVAPRGSRLVITFDTNGTQDPRDDLPLQIVAVSDFYAGR